MSETSLAEAPVCILKPEYVAFSSSSDSLEDIFVNTRAIEFAHDFPHRYGKSRNLKDYIEGTNDDYFMGVLATSITFTIILLLWILLGVYFSRNPSLKHRVRTKILCEKVGPPKDRHLYENRQEYSQDWQAWKDARNKHRKITKGCAILGCVGIVVSAILMSAVGVSNMENSLHSAIEAIQIGQTLTLGGTRFLDDILAADIRIGKELSELFDEVANICPLLKEEVCETLEDLAPSFECRTTENSNQNSNQTTDAIPTTFDDEIVNDADMITNATIAPDSNSTNSTDILELLGLEFIGEIIERWDNRTTLPEAIREAREDLLKMYDSAIELEETANGYDWALQIARGFAIILALFSCVMLAGLVLPASTAQPILTCLRRRFIMPVFVCNALLCWAFSNVFNIGSTLVADVCIDSPDPKIEVLLQKFRDELGKILFDYLVYYVKQCPVDEVPLGLGEWNEFLTDLLSQTSRTLEEWAKIPDKDWQEFCGVENDQRAVEVAESVSQQLCGMANYFTDLQEYFACDNFRPLYTTATYEAMCYDGTQSFLWLAVSQAAIVVCTMLVLSSKTAFFENEKELKDSLLEDSEMEDDLLLEEDEDKPQVLPSCHSGFEVEAILR